MNRRDRPKVLVNFAITADGKTSTRNCTPARFTSPRDKQRLLEIRAMGDALMVGRNTLAADTMRMTIGNRELQARRRARGLPSEPIRVVVSNRGNIDPAWPLFRARGGRRVIFSTTRMPEATRQSLLAHADLHLLDGRSIPVEDVLMALRSIYDVRTLVCEGGPRLVQSLAEIDAIDTLFLTVAPFIFGGKDAPGLLGDLQEFLPSVRHFALESMRTVGGECYLRYARARK
jgi:Pyrimidine reductase, riboflavin biosynthesis